MRGVRGQEHAGEFRDIQNYVGNGDRGITAARFIPPPVFELTSVLDAFEHYLAEARELPPLVHVALVHYQFETIHPFRDGNGRIGRLLSALQLCAKGHYGREPLLHNPHLYLSVYFERHRQDYYDHLLAVSTQGAWRQWIEFFLMAVISQSEDAIERSNKLLALWEELRGELQTARSSALLLQLLDNLFARPAISIPRAQRLLGVTYRAAANNIQKLVDAGILEELPESLRPKMYIANRILDILQEE
jgi:Fic family protein